MDAEEILATDLSVETLEVSGESQLADVTSGNLAVTGTLTVNGQAYAPTQSNMEIVTYQLGGSDNSVSGTLALTQNTTNTTNYTVFPSVYYGYSGSSGTYGATQTSGAVCPVVISNITSSSFTWNVEKSTGDGVNVYLVFLVVYNVSGSNYAKSY